MEVITQTSIAKTITTTQFNVTDYCGTNPSEADFYGRNCFIRAAKAGEIKVLKYLNSYYPELKNQKDDLVYGNFVQNRSGSDFKILTNWKVSFDDEDQHASNWIF